MSQDGLEESPGDEQLHEDGQPGSYGDEHGVDDGLLASPGTGVDALSHEFEGEEGEFGDEGEGELEEGESVPQSREGFQQPSILGTPYDGNKEDLDDAEDMPNANRFDALLSQRSRSASSRGSRPGSAVINLRGSRPNSAAVAQEIDGFEDDFMERVEEEEEPEPEPETEEEEDTGPTVEELIERAQFEQQRLLEGNENLQRKVRMALDFRNKGRPQVNRDVTRLDGASTRYRSALKQWVEVLEERDAIENHYQTTIFDMKSTLEERIKRADDISKAYKHFRLEVAKSSEYGKTAKTISERLLAQMENEDQQKEEEVQRVRLKNIHLMNQLRRIEHTLRQKEELAEGLHLIDFEQLKIENQSLNEKIEERNEELLKLRKKTTTTVQILTHVREKLQFIEKENGSLSTQLEDIDKELAEKRDRLGKAKASRDTLRLKGRKIKETSVFITNPSLLEDIEAQKDKKEQMAIDIEQLKEEYATLAESISKTNARIMNLTEDLANSGNPGVIQLLRSISTKTSAVAATGGTAGKTSMRSTGGK